MCRNGTQLCIRCRLHKAHCRFKFAFDPHKSLIYLASINWRFFEQNLQDPPNHRIAIYPAGINCRFLKWHLRVLPIAQEFNLILQIIAGSTKAQKSNLSHRCQLPMLETKLVLSTGMTTKNQLARTGIAVLYILETRLGVLFQ